jgi:hypothetical protein
MSKRFTITEKWKDKWFMELSPIGKLMFVYMCDNCDCAGVWEVNFGLAAYQIKKDVPAIEGAFKEIEKSYIRQGEKVWIKNFLRHQGNVPLSTKNKAHIGIANAIKSHGVFAQTILSHIEIVGNNDVFEGGYKGDISPTSIGIGIGNGKGSSPSISKGGVGEKQIGINPDEIDLIIQEWNWGKSQPKPVSEAVQFNVRADIARVLAGDTYTASDIIGAIRNYRTVCELESSRLQHRWNLSNFLMRDAALAKFRDGMFDLDNYTAKESAQTFSDIQRQKADEATRKAAEQFLGGSND